MFSVLGTRGHMDARMGGLQRWRVLHRHTKRGSASRVSVELQIKATVRYPTPTEMTNDKRRKGVLRRWRKVGTLVVCGGKCELVWPLWKQFGGPPKSYTEQFHAQVYNQKKWKGVFKQKLVPGCIYIRALSYNIYKVQTTQILINRWVSK